MNRKYAIRHTVRDVLTRGGIKTVLIFLLVAVDLLLGFYLARLYGTRNVLPSATADDVASLMSDAGIELDASDIPRRKTNGRVLRSESGEDYHEALTACLTGETDGTWHMTTSGTRCITASGAVLDFRDDDRFAVTFLSPDFTGELPGSLTIDADGEASLSARKAKKLLKSFLRIDGVEPEITGIGRCQETDGVLVTADVLIDGRAVAANALAFLIRDGKIAAVTGRLCLPLEAEELTADPLGVVDILLRERSDADGTPRAVASLDEVWCVSWSADRTSFYMVPGWRIVYRDGGVTVRDAVSGAVQ